MIGAGIAGLLVAHVIGGDVVVLERDKLSDEPRYRAGVPQGRHVHGLLVRGAEIMEDLLPGLRQELVAAGAYLTDAGDARLLNTHGWAAGGRTGLPLLTVTRPLLETHIRRRVTAKVLDGVHVTGLSFSGSTVDGVLTGDGRIDADLVVDASGRSSKLATWLAAAGVVVPQPSVVDSRTGYATRLYTAPPDFPAVLAESLSAPSTPRGCAVMRVEGDRLMVTAQGAGGDHPPRDPSGYQEFLESLRLPVAEMLRPAEPLSPVYLFARTASRRNAFEDTRSWPGGLVAIGDAVCSFNPVYGQGMTVAAMEALLFRRHQDFSAAGCVSFQRRIARTTRSSWLLSSGADRGWVGDARPGPASRVFAWYMKKWQIAITRDADMFRRFIRVVNMVAGPATLLSPVVFRRLMVSH
ncbi:hypothetical protein Lesp02_41570 [Lentzea sp. NBRC 105346]|nr:hypothetical protein Lesp02_41570 [Lentzea sp. NBRC 105346]